MCTCGRYTTGSDVGVSHVSGSGQVIEGCGWMGDRWGTVKNLSVSSLSPVPSLSRHPLCGHLHHALAQRGSSHLPLLAK